MLGLPRRFLRQLFYFFTFFVFAIFLVLYANKQKVIHLNDYLPSSFTPAFFQPSADHFISDIRIGSCLRINGNNPLCGVPSGNDGIGSWSRLDKNLNLGNSWLKKQYLSYKLVTDDEINGRAEKAKRAPVSSTSSSSSKLVIVDIAIEKSSDAKIPGNKMNLPEHILKEFHWTKVFDDESHENLVKVKAGNVDVEKEQLAKENTKSSKAKAKEQEAEKEFHLEDPKKDPKEADGEDVEKEAIIEEGEKAKQEKVVEEKTEQDFHLEKRGEESSRSALNIEYSIPSAAQVIERGWVNKGNGIWVKYGPYTDSDAITGIDVLFGEDCVDPRPNWKLLKSHGSLKDVGNTDDKAAYISIRRGPRVDYKQKAYQPTLKVNKEGKFKILQVADLHFSTGVGKCRDPWPVETAIDCEADPRTLKFLERVLDIEQPDFVVLTGDQIMGDTSPDAETSVFKALNPFIQRKIPFAITLGNHDDEGSLSREEIFALSSSLPFSFSETGPSDIAGVGNYILNIAGSSISSPGINMYFLDTHKYSPNPKVNPGYDWLKESQIDWLKEQGTERKGNLNMAWFHIPIPEYRNIHQSYIGEYREPPTAPKYNTGARDVLQKIGVKIASVGHDHVNDYCLLDVAKKDTNLENKIWLCYGGASGEGGYGGWGGYVRRLRTFEIDSVTQEIKTWKRREDKPLATFDEQIIVANGELANF